MPKSSRSLRINRGVCRTLHRFERRHLDEHLRQQHLLVLSLLGPIALAVTTSLNINFLSKPSAADVIAEGRILKLGKRLVVAEISMRSASDSGVESRIVAHATVTYSIPPKR